MSTTLHGKVSRQNSGTSGNAADETIAADHLPHNGTGTATHAKICCICGANVAGERRYKDAAGRYWCCDCAKADEGKKHPVACPECGQSFPATDLVDHNGTPICTGCHDKRVASEKRAAARKAAAEEEARLQQIRHKRVLIAAAALAGVLVAYAAFHVMMG